jgi:hypothetical protein
MTLALAGREITVRDTGHTVCVSNHCIARIMYYMSCCARVLTLPIPDRLMDWKHCNTLSDDEIVDSYERALQIPLDLMVRIGAFVRVTELPGENSNTFLEITDTRFAALADSEVVIAGAQVRIVKVMAFKDTWMYYY